MKREHSFSVLQISYAVSKVLEPDDRLAAAGTFTIGICPGGSASHIYAYLLYGDLALSITMTVLGYLVAFGRYQDFCRLSFSPAYAPRQPILHELRTQIRLLRGSLIRVRSGCSHEKI